MRDRENHPQHDVIAAGGEPDDLPRAGEFLRQFGDGQDPRSSIQTGVCSGGAPEWNSFRHQLEPSHAFETRNSTASQRSAASLSERSQRAPAAMPRCGSRSRKISSFQPLLASQSRKATASALFSLEWLRKIRDTPRPSRWPATLQSSDSFGSVLLDGLDLEFGLERDRPIRSRLRNAVGVVTQP